MTDNQQSERRKFSRITLQADAHIHQSNGDLYLRCSVVDISLKGLLIHTPSNWRGARGSTFHIDIVIDNAQLVIKMRCVVAHVDKEYVGFSCEHIDIESITHLKQLIAFNVGNTELLDRELSSLLTQ